MHDSEYDNPCSSADKSSISLITLRDVCEGDDTRQADVESMDQATSPSLISSSQEQGRGDTIGSFSNPIADHENEDSVLFRNRETIDSGSMRKLFGLVILLRYICVQPEAAQYQIVG